MKVSYSISGMANASEPNKKKPVAKKKAAPLKGSTEDVSPPKKAQPRKKKPAYNPAAADNDNDGNVEQAKKPAVAPKFKKADIEDFANMIDVLTAADFRSVTPAEPPKVPFGQRVLGFFHRGTRPPK
jgi:hypothetical protein